MKIKFLGMVLVFSLLLVSFTFAVPWTPHQFYGTISFNNGENVGAGFILKAYIGKEVVATTYTLNGKYGYNPFIFFITDPEGNRRGKTISFKLYDPNTKHTYSIMQTHTFKPGNHTKLDLKTTENYVPPASRGGGGHSSPSERGDEISETEKKPNEVGSKSELDKINELITSNKIEEAKEALSKIEEKQKSELDSIYASKTLLEDLSITLDDLKVIGLSFRAYQRALKDLKTARELMDTAENTEDLEAKLRLISAVKLLKEQIEDKIPEVTQIKEISEVIKPTEEEISDALSIATDEQVKSFIISLSNRSIVPVEKRIEVYKIKYNQTGREIYKSKVIIKIKDVNAEIIEIIPKEIVDNVDKITFRGLMPEILQRDPIVKWVPLSTEDKIEYLLPVKMDKIDNILTLAVRNDLCGDGICQDGENCSTCEVDCGTCSSKSTFPTGHAVLTNSPVFKTMIIAILVVALIVILRFLYVKKSQKDKVKKSR